MFYILLFLGSLLFGLILLATGAVLLLKVKNKVAGIFVGAIGLAITLGQLTIFISQVISIRVDTPRPAQAAISTLPAASEPTKKTGNAPSSPTPLTEQLSPAPICFTPEEMLPFAFTPEAAGLMVRTSSGVQMFDLKAGAQDAFIHASQNVITAALSPDGQILAWSLQDGTIQLIRLSDKKILADLSGHPDPVYDLQFSPAQDRLFSASHDGLVRIWDLDGEQLASIDASGEVLGFGLSGDGSMLVTIPSDGPLLLWDLAGYTKIGEFGGSGGYDTSDAHFSPDGQYLAADLVSGIFLWRVSDASLVWHEVKNSMAVAFSPDGRYLAYSDVDDDNKVFLASPDAARVFLTIDRMQGPIWELFFSPDSSLLVATDGIEIRIWRVEDGTLLYIGKAACP
jgi:hypothetical protein